MPMEDGDRGDCPVELLACPEHRDEQLRLMGIFGADDLPLSKGDAESSIFKDKEGARIVGFCLWCNKDFYSIEEMEAHNADDSKECPVFRKWKSTH